MTFNEQVSVTRGTTRSAPLDLEPETFRTIGHELVDRITDHLAGIADRPVAPDTTPAAFRTILGDTPLPDTGTDAATLVANATELLFNTLHLQRSPAVLGLHHCFGSAHRRAGGAADRGGEPERRSLGLGAHRDRDRGADDPLDRRATRLSARR